MHHHKRFLFIKIKWLIYIHPLCCEGFTKNNIKPKLCFHVRIYRDIFIFFHSEEFTKTLQKKLLCLLWNFIPLCVKISFTFTAVWKQKLHGFTVLPFHCCETIHGFTYFPWFSSFSSRPSPALLCVFTLLTSHALQCLLKKNLFSH